ncbi:MAG: ATP-binding protein [Candidatus Eisenbacteria bacterium]
MRAELIWELKAWDPDRGLTLAQGCNDPRVRVAAAACEYERQNVPATKELLHGLPADLDAVFRVRALWLEADLAKHAGENETSRAALDSADELVKTLGPGSQELEGLLALARASLLVQTGGTDEVLDFANIALTRLQPFPTTVYTSRVHSAMARALGRMGNVSAAIDHLGSCVEIARSIDSKRELATALHNLACAVATGEDYEGAVALARESLAVPFEPESSPLRHRSRSLLVDVLFELERLEEAESEARALLADLGDGFDRMRASSLCTLAGILGEQGRSEESLRAIDSAVSIIPDPADWSPQEGQAIHHFRARAFVALGKAEEALEEIDRAVELVKSTALEETLAAVLLTRAEILTYLGRGREARETMTEAMRFERLMIHRVLNSSTQAARFRTESEIAKAKEQVLLDAQEQLEKMVEERTRSLSEANLALRREADQRTKAEQRSSKLMGFLSESERLRAVGQSAATIAHDVQNTLLAILASAHTLRNAELEGAPKKALDCLIHAAEHGVATTRGILDFAVETPADRGDGIDVRDLIAKVTVHARALVPSRIRFQVENETNAFIEGNPNELERVLINLILNGRDAIEGPGELTITTRDSDRFVRPDHSYVEIAVRDSGHGIPADIRDRIFEPLFTTKKGSGAGLGLWGALRSAQRAGGAIQVESSIDEGTTMTVLLPRSEIPSTRKG